VAWSVTSWRLLDWHPAVRGRVRRRRALSDVGVNFMWVSPFSLSTYVQEQIAYQEGRKPGDWGRIPAQ